MRVFDSPINLPSAPLEAGAWVPAGQRFGYQDQALLLPSLRLGYRSAKKFKVTMVIATEQLIDIWYDDSTGAEQRLTLYYERHPSGTIYVQPAQL